MESTNNKEPHLNYKTWPAGELNPTVKVGDNIIKYDQVFTWTSQHITGSDLISLTQQGDPLGDEALPYLESKGKSRIQSLETLAISPDCPPPVKALYHQVNTIPDWVDFHQIRRGQEFYWKTFYHNSLILQTHSLISDFTVSSIVGVLTCTGYLSSPKSAYRRAVETSYMVTSAMEREQLKPGGTAWEVILNTRLMHSQARRHVTKVINRGSEGAKHLTKERLAINQEDLMFTLLLFAVTVIQGYDKLNIKYTLQQREDYLATFRYVAYLIGIDDTLNHLSSYESALALKQSLDMHLIQPDSKSSHMAKVVLYSFHKNPPFYLDYRHLCQMSRFLMTDKMGDDLNLPHSQTGRDLSFRCHFEFQNYLHLTLLHLAPHWYLNLFESKVIDGYRQLLRGPPKFQFQPFDEDHDFSVQYPILMSDYLPHFLLVLVVLGCWLYKPF